MSYLLHPQTPVRSMPLLRRNVRPRIAQFPWDEERVQDLLLEYDLLMERSGIALTKLASELTALPGIYDGPSGMVVVAEVDSRDLGCAAMVKRGPDCCEIRRLYVRRDNGSTEVLRAIVDAAQAFAGYSGCRHIMLGTIPSVDALYGPSRELGFREDSVRCGIFDDAQGRAMREAVCMRLDL